MVKKALYRLAFVVWDKRQHMRPVHRHLRRSAIGTTQRHSRHPRSAAGRILSVHHSVSSATRSESVLFALATLRIDATGWWGLREGRSGEERQQAEEERASSSHSLATDLVSLRGSENPRNLFENPLADLKLWR